MSGLLFSNCSLVRVKLKHSEKIKLWPGPSPVSRAALHPDSVQRHILLCTVFQDGRDRNLQPAPVARRARDRSHQADGARPHEMESSLPRHHSRLPPVRIRSFAARLFGPHLFPARGHSTDLTTQRLVFRQLTPGYSEVGILLQLAQFLLF